MKKNIFYFGFLSTTVGFSLMTGCKTRKMNSTAKSDLVSAALEESLAKHESWNHVCFNGNFSKSNLDKFTNEELSTSDFASLIETMSNSYRYCQGENFTSKVLFPKSPQAASRVYRLKWKKEGGYLQLNFLAKNEKKPIYKKVPSATTFDTMKQLASGELSCMNPLEKLKGKPENLEDSFGQKESKSGSIIGSEKPKIVCTLLKPELRMFRDLQLKSSEDLVLADYKYQISHTKEKDYLLNPELFGEQLTQLKASLFKQDPRTAESIVMKEINSLLFNDNSFSREKYDTLMLNFQKSVTFSKSVSLSWIDTGLELLKRKDKAGNEIPADKDDTILDFLWQPMVENQKETLVELERISEWHQKNNSSASTEVALNNIYSKMQVPKASALLEAGIAVVRMKILAATYKDEIGEYLK